MKLKLTGSVLFLLFCSKAALAMAPTKIVGESYSSWVTFEGTRDQPTAEGSWGTPIDMIVNDDSVQLTVREQAIDRAHSKTITCTISKGSVLYPYALKIAVNFQKGALLKGEAMGGTCTKLSIQRLSTDSE